MRAASRERRERHRQALRRTIVETAARLVLERGYERFSLREVAQEIGYTPTTIYRYFADKDDLLSSVVGEGFREFGARLEAAARRVSDPIARIRAIGRAYVRFALERPIQYQLMFVHRLDLLAPKGHGDPQTGASFDVLRNAVAAAKAKRQVALGDVETLSLVLWASVHGVASLALADGPLFPRRRAEQVHRLCQQLIERGLRS